MASNDLQALETQIEAKKRDFAKAEGVMEQTEARWQKDYSLTDADQVEELKNGINNQVASLTKKRQDLLAKAQTILNGEA